jgi:hypothetical protein
MATRQPIGTTQNATAVIQRAFLNLVPGKVRSMLEKVATMPMGMLSSVVSRTGNPRPEMICPLNE